MNIKYRRLDISECLKIREIDASQYIGQAWREVDGKRQLVKIDYYEPDLPNGFDAHLRKLIETVNSGGVVLGAFHDMRLVGYCSANSLVFGEKYKYVLLDQLYISKNFRNKGIGKRLFFMAADKSKENGAEKFYICAGSSEETIAFYYAIGCKEAMEINEELFQSDTRDMQLEYDFRKL